MKKIAYLVLAHSDPTHFGRLCKTLNNDYCDIYVHIDAKHPESIFREAAGISNIYYIKQRVSVSWAGISMIEAQNSLLKQALANKLKYTHMVFISGSCYPIKNTRQIYETLTQTPCSQYIKYIDMRQSPEHYMKHIAQKWFKEPVLGNVNSRLLQFIDKAIRKLLNKLRIQNHWNEKMVPYFGSQWFALTIDCCQYLMDFQNENPWYKRMNRYTFSPDEHFYHTIIGNSKFAASSTGLQPFEGRGTWRLANFHIIDPSLSKWYTVEDWEEIADSDKFFVRKVRSFDGKDLVDRINSELLA